MRSFGPYTNLVEIGRGGMATVYRATAPDGGLVALKILAIHLAADPTARIRFEQESNLGLVHPNIVRVIRAGVEGETPFIEMEYVPGQSLDRYILRNGAMSPPELAPILRDAASALDYAHARGIVHRDVKPSNILIRADGRALLADFGVAKAANVTAFTATRARVGSVFFMSPEQAGGTFEITQATDIYSLGVTAYYALTCRHPFEGDNEIAIARQHIDRQPRHVSEVRPDVPRPVGDVVMWAMEKSPRRRPTSAGEFARHFERALTAPISAPPESAGPAIAAPGVQAQPVPVVPASDLTTDTVVRRARVPGIVVAIIALAMICVGLAAVLALTVPSVQPEPATVTPGAAAPVPGLSVFTPQPSPTSFSVLVPLTPPTVEPMPQATVIVNVIPTTSQFQPLIVTAAAPMPVPTQPPPIVRPAPTIWIPPPALPTIPIVFPTGMPFPPPTAAPLTAVPPTAVPLPSPTVAPPPTIVPPTVAPPTIAPPTVVLPTSPPPTPPTPSVIVTIGS